MLLYFYKNPKCGEVYNIGGSKFSNISMLEAIELVEKVCKKKLDYEYVDKARTGDHIWWITDNSKFQAHYPRWKLTYDITRIIEEIYLYQRKIY